MIRGRRRAARCGNTETALKPDAEKSSGEPYRRGYANVIPFR